MASETIEQALMVRLLASTAVDDVVGNRIFFAAADQGATMPYCTYHVVSDPHDPFAYGTYKDSGQARVQFSLYGRDRFGVLTAAHAIRDHLDQFSGGMDSVTVISLNCGGVLTHAVEEEDNVFHASFDAMIRYVDP